MRVGALALALVVCTAHFGSVPSSHHAACILRVSFFFLLHFLLTYLLSLLTQASLLVQALQATLGPPHTQCYASLSVVRLGRG
jgi:hypothetical protein